MSQANEKTIELDGDTWTVVSVGATFDDLVVVHLASTTRGHSQKNGFVPVQIVDRVPAALLED